MQLTTSRIQPLMPDLTRFLTAQSTIYNQVLSELRAGHKRTHWIWFIFPQITGLGSSPTSQQFAITSLAEAQAYIDHPILSTRLRECTQLVLTHKDRDIARILGYPDDLKFRSSMTLFRQTTGDTQLFQSALDIFFDGKPDQLTLDRF